MGVPQHTIEKEALGLAPGDRAKLAGKLIQSLDKINKHENEIMWVEESHRRYGDYKKGKISAKPASSVMKNAYLVVQKKGSW